MTAPQARQSANGQVPAPPRPDPGKPPLLRCRCGAAWLDDDEGRHAHRVVFGHQPRTAEAARPPEEAQP